MHRETAVRERVRDRPARPMLTHHRLLGARLYLFVRIRVAAAALIVGGALLARDVLRVEGLDVAGLLWLALAIAAYDGVATVYARRFRVPVAASADAPPAAVEAVWRRLRPAMLTVIGLDFLALTVGIWLVGGVRSPFLSFYLLHVAIGCLLLTRGEAIAIGGGAVALIVALAAGEWTGAVPPRLPIGLVPDAGPLDGRLAITVPAVYGVLVATAVGLVSALAARLRAGERVLRTENLALDRQASLRRDFLHVALHDIQSMVGVVTAHLRNMDAGLGGALAEPHRAWVVASLERLDRIGRFLREFRMLESLTTEALDAQLRDVDVAPLLEEIVAIHRDEAEARRHTLTLEAPSSLPAVRAIPELLREAVANYVANAIKYTPDGGHVVVRALRRPDALRIEVEDDGIGIDPADLPRLFTEFVRLDCSGTPVAGVQGTGLGLSIVRRVVERFGGTTDVRSRPGEGSTFGLELPVAGAVTPAPSP